jgi:hypothetical protein
MTYLLALFHIVLIAARCCLTALFLKIWFDEKPLFLEYVTALLLSGRLPPVFCSYHFMQHPVTGDLERSFQRLARD